MPYTPKVYSLGISSVSLSLHQTVHEILWMPYFDECPDFCGTPQSAAHHRTYVPKAAIQSVANRNRQTNLPALDEILFLSSFQVPSGSGYSADLGICTAQSPGCRDRLMEWLGWIFPVASIKFDRQQHRPRHQQFSCG